MTTIPTGGRRDALSMRKAMLLLQDQCVRVGFRMNSFEQQGHCLDKQQALYLV